MDSDRDRERARQRIGISRDQQRQIEALYKETEGEKRKMRGWIENRYRELDRLHESYVFDRGHARNLVNIISRLQQRLLGLHLETEEKLRRILTREQFDRMRAQLREEREKRERRRSRRDDDDDDDDN